MRPENEMVSILMLVSIGMKCESSESIATKTTTKSTTSKKAHSASSLIIVRAWVQVPGADILPIRVFTSFGPLTVQVQEHSKSQLSVYDSSLHGFPNSNCNYSGSSRGPSLVCYCTARIFSHDDHKCMCRHGKQSGNFCRARKEPIVLPYHQRLELMGPWMLT